MFTAPTNTVSQSMSRYDSWASRLTKAGLHVVGLERGRVRGRNTGDFQEDHDELRYAIRNELFQNAARKAAVATNGDGFGLGWYGDLPKPGLYRDTMPAWNDLNLRSLSEQIRSRLFFAHVRASTGTSTARVNCHPFRYDRWLFMHNGQVGGWPIVRRELENLIADRLFHVD